jgi:hypothetical protein
MRRTVEMLVSVEFEDGVRVRGMGADESPDLDAAAVDSLFPLLREAIPKVVQAMAQPGSDEHTDVIVTEVNVSEHTCDLPPWQWTVAQMFDSEFPEPH